MQPIDLSTKHVQYIPILQCLHLFKSYGPGQDVFRDAHLEVHEGDFLFILGQTGAGKTTLLKLLLGMEPLNSGQILIEGHNIHNLPPREVPIFRRRVTIVFQDFKLLMHRSVFENVALPLEVTGKDKRVVMRKVQQILRLLGYHRKRDVPCSRLSKGEQQLVAIARAAVNDPVIIIADEPTGHLDKSSMHAAFEFLRNLRAKGTTIVLATRNASLPLHVPECRIATLEGGRIVENSSYVSKVSWGASKDAG